MSTYRLQVPFVDAATLAPQRITLADGKTIDLKLPAGVETGTQMKLAGKGQPGPGGAGDAIVTIEIGNHPFYIRDGDNVRLDLPVSLGRGREGRQGQGADGRWPGHAGHSPPAPARARRCVSRARASPTKSGGARRSAGHAADRPAGRAMPRFERFADDWSDTRNLRGHLGV